MLFLVFAKAGSIGIEPHSRDAQPRRLICSQRVVAFAEAGRGAQHSPIAANKRLQNRGRSIELDERMQPDNSGSDAEEVVGTAARERSLMCQPSSAFRSIQRKN